LKNIFLILILSILNGWIVGCATVAIVHEEKVSIVEVSGQSQDEIFNKTRQWFSDYFVSGKSVVDYEDHKTGVIIGKGIANYGSDTFGIITYSVDYTIRIDTKDGKFKVTTKIIKHTNTDLNQTYPVFVFYDNERETSAVAHLDKLVNDIRAYVMTPKSKKSNW